MDEIPKEHGLSRRAMIDSTLAAAGGLALAAAAGGAQAQTGTTLKAGDETFHELRLYQIQQGRMADMHARMRNDLAPLFSRHGINVVGAWQASQAPSPLFVYLIHWKSWAARLEGWGGFYADPKWLEVRARTNAGSDLVQRQELIMCRSFSPLPSLRSAADQELLSIPVTIGRLPAVIDALPAVAGSLRKGGGDLLGGFEHLFGADIPRISLLVQGRGPDLSPLDKLTDGPISSRVLKHVDYPIA